MKRLLCLVCVCAIMGCKSSNHSQPYVPDNTYVPEYGNTSPNAPRPGQGHYLGASVNQEACVGEVKGDQIKLLRAPNPVNGQFSFSYTFDEQMLGRFDKAELIIYSAPGGQPDYSTYYLVETIDNFAPGVEHQLCSESARVLFYDGSEPRAVDTFPGGKYRLELKAEGEEDTDYVNIDLNIIN